MSWVKNSNGEPSATLTFMLLSFLIVAFCVIAPMFNGFIIRGFEFHIEKPDNALIIAMLAAFVPAYVIRRNTNDKLNGGTNGEETVEPPVKK